jgi:glutamyl-tRNA(Gln) amidotransferase subunit D
MAAAVTIARTSDLGEVVVVMHAGLSDDRFAVHRGTRVRKMHSSRRDAFRSRNAPPLGFLDASGLHLEAGYRTRSSGPTRVSGPLDARAQIVWFHPGLDPERVAASVAGLRGVILAGTGLGHVSSVHLPWIREAVRRGTIVAMTTQCLEGEADPFVYATGRELARSGVLYLRDLLPEVAFAKLLWALGRSSDPQEIARLMIRDRAGEFESRHQPGPL